MGQSVWNTGNLGFIYQSFPSPAESFELSGDLISDEIPHAGVGGFELSLEDTNLVTLVSYDLYVSGSDTLADIFVIFMSDALPLEEGSYTVNLSPDALKIFVWLSEVNPESLAGLIDASFTLEDLASFNPYLSASGEFEIIANNDFHFGMDFSGIMINASSPVRIVSDGHIELWNTLPISIYTRGSMDYSVGSETGSIIGVLNPLTESEGAGALRTQSGDTLTYNFISYLEQPDNSYDVYGVVLIGNETHFPVDGSESQFNISLTDATLPHALPYMMQDVDLDEIFALLESGELPALDQLDQLYLPIGLGIATFTFTSEGNALLDMDNVLMSNSTADVTTLSTDWLLTNNLPSAIRDDIVLSPNSTRIVGAAFPNPFNSSTMIPIQLTAGATLEARLYNLSGQEVRKIDFGYRGSGHHQLSIDLGLTNLGSGIYYYSLFDQQIQLGSSSFVYLK